MNKKNSPKLLKLFFLYLLSLGKATKDQRVFRNSVSGNSVANLKFSRVSASNRRFSQQKSTAIWNVVTSKSYLPTEVAMVMVPLDM